MEGFLNNLSKFNNSLLNLLFPLFSIKIVSFREFRYVKIAKMLYFQRFYHRSIFVTLLPLNRGRGFAGYVIHNSVNVFYFVNDTARDFIQYVIGDSRPVSRHKVCCRYAS